MEYSLKGKAGKVSAEMLVKLPQGTIPREEVLPKVYEGIVLRPLRRADPQVRNTNKRERVRGGDLIPR